MQCLPNNPLLKFHPDTLEEVRKTFNLEKPGDMDKAIDIFVEWIKQQNHLVKKDFRRDYLERILITNKGSLERSKMRFDKLCTLRTLMPQFYGKFNLRNEAQRIDGILLQAVLPKLTEDHHRVFMLKVITQNREPGITNNYMRITFHMAEFLSSTDYFRGAVIIADYSETNIANLVSSLNINEIQESMTILMEGFGLRLKAYHLISSSMAIDILTTILKQVFSKKIADRIHVHKTIESVYEYIPKDILPENYGGKEKSLEKLHDDLIDACCSEEYKEHYMEISKACTDESLRQTDKFNDQYMGMPGTFRTLNVD